MVVHCNHENELNEQTAVMFQHVRTSGTMVFNQSVLLRGVNDSAEALAALSWRLFDQGVLPYYLHLLDKVRGSAHFDVPVEDAKAIYARVRE
jgi:L-lysine 2,3-aminomutase